MSTSVGDDFRSANAQETMRPLQARQSSGTKRRDPIRRPRAKTRRPRRGEGETRCAPFLQAAIERTEAGPFVTSYGPAARSLEASLLRPLVTARPLHGVLGGRDLIDGVMGARALIETNFDRDTIGRDDLGWPTRTRPKAQRIAQSTDQRTTRVWVS